MRTVFEESGAQAGAIALGSVKSQIGHTKATAGAAGFFKALMGLRSNVLPPTIKVQQPNPNLNIDDTPLYINTEARPWVRGTELPRRAGVSAFGFGGSNFHILLEEYTGPNKAPRLRAWGHELCLYSAESAEEMTTLLQSVLDRHDKVSLSRLSWESQQSFSTERALRLSVVLHLGLTYRRKPHRYWRRGLLRGILFQVVFIWAWVSRGVVRRRFFSRTGCTNSEYGLTGCTGLTQSMEVWDFLQI